MARRVMMASGTQGGSARYALLKMEGGQKKKQMEQEEQKFSPKLPEIKGNPEIHGTYKKKGLEDSAPAAFHI